MVLGMSVVHVLWECSAYSNIRGIFVEKLQELLGNRYANFDKLNSIEKTAYVRIRKRALGI